MPNFLFWNLAKRPIAELVRRLAETNDVDVLVLAECSLEPLSMLLELNRQEPVYQFAFGRCEKVRFFTRFDATLLEPIYDGQRYAIRRLSLPGRLSILVAAAHLPSKMNCSNESQMVEVIDFAETILQVEEQEGHHRTVVLGDLNVNPFEEGMVAAKGLNAVMSRAVAMKRSRTVSGKSYPFFFNPMWAHLGDHSEHPVGTYYYDSSEHVNYYWNAFDQVLIRPDLAQQFQHEDLRVLTRAGDISLIKPDGVPHTGVASDHLPILLKLEF